MSDCLASPAGYQLTSAECFDMRSGRVVVDQYCHYYPENIKPKPKLQECNMEPCLARLETRPLMTFDFMCFMMTQQIVSSELYFP